MKKSRTVKRATRAEVAYVRDMRSRSGLVMLEKGEAELLAPIQYPESLKRFLRRERLMVHVRLSAAMRRKLELKARRTGIPPDELARRWIEHGLRNAV